MAVPAGMNGTTGKRGPEWPVTVGVYSVLFLFGAVQGVIGSFQYSRASGSVPVVALVCCAVILATCLLASWAMGSVSGAVMPGMGWVIASFVLSMPVSNGSVIITGTTPGKWYLYGGTLSVAAGVVASFAIMARRAGRPGATGISPR
ncbi:MAG TPA: DUF6113 family protein [Streptosporangiaceae bacterium]